ncbi:response regulator [uncultured Kocuria sp.]|uniref:response regulator n=1 Tax=uncultured Kocuria sp. TaxID=259305 RepID=UPI00259534F4|nr:response regulator [uncultured Kocuria sp.]MCT1367069.1 response regulator [Rothia sp. p3-SID1597]
MITVLVLDDDLYVGQLHCQYVSEVPEFQVLEPVRDLRSAREVLAGGGVDLLLADHVLPDGRGVDLVREFDVDAILLSAVNDATVVRSALRAGALTYIFKPFEATYLQGVLRRYARYRRMWDRERLSQADLDRALRALHDASSATGRHNTAPPSSTTAKVLECLRAHDGVLSAVDVADAVGISRATAQRHLAKLAGTRAATVSLHYGSTGRPEHLYAAAPEW